jgi:hypothetical protein
MSRGLGTFQRRILDALEPAQPVCRRPGEQTMRPKEPHDGPCIPEYCYGWLPKGVPWEWAQLPLDVYDLVDVRAYLSWQEAPRWAEVVRAAGDPGRHPFTPERVAWALAQVGKPHARSFGADIARALRGLLERAELVPCHRIELVRYIPHPRLDARRHPWPWIHHYSDEEAVLYYPPERRVRFVRRGEAKR